MRFINLTGITFVFVSDHPNTNGYLIIDPTMGHEYTELRSLRLRVISSPVFEENFDDISIHEAFLIGPMGYRLVDQNGNVLSSEDIPVMDGRKYIVPYDVAAFIRQEYGFRDDIVTYDEKDYRQSVRYLPEDIQNSLIRKDGLQQTAMCLNRFRRFKR